MKKRTRKDLAIAAGKKEPKGNSQLKEAVSTAIVVSALEKKASSAIKKLNQVDPSNIKSQAEYDLAYDQLKFIKAVGKEADQEKEKMLAGIKTTEKAIRNFFRPFEDKRNKLEEDYKAGMIQFELSKEEKVNLLNEKFKDGKVKSIGVYSEKMEELSNSKGTRSIQKLKIVSPNKVPRKFLITNDALIKATLLKGKSVPGCKLVEDKTIAI